MPRNTKAGGQSKWMASKMGNGRRRRLLCNLTTLGYSFCASENNPAVSPSHFVHNAQASQPDLSLPALATDSSRMLAV